MPSPEEEERERTVSRTVIVIVGRDDDVAAGSFGRNNFADDNDVELERERILELLLLQQLTPPLRRLARKMNIISNVLSVR